VSYNKRRPHKAGYFRELLATNSDIGSEQGGFLRCVACQVLPLTRLSEGAKAPDDPIDKFRDWHENTNSIF
jgi:hypothetical protein